MFKLINNNITNNVLLNLKQSVKMNGPRWMSSVTTENSNNNCSEKKEGCEICEPPIPLYQRYNETYEVKKARLVYQSRKRGMLENDLLLSTFAHRYLDTFDNHQLDMYDTLINSPSNDWDLFYWVVGKKDTPEQFNNPIMDLLKEHAKNTSKENRTRQPSLY